MTNKTRPLTVKGQALSQEYKKYIRANDACKLLNKFTNSEDFNIFFTLGNKELSIKRVRQVVESSDYIVMKQGDRAVKEYTRINGNRFQKKIVVDGNIVEEKVVTPDMASMSVAYWLLSTKTTDWVVLHEEKEIHVFQNIK